MKVLASDSVAKRLLKSKTRALVAIVVLGLIGSMALAFAAESLKQHRKHRGGQGGRRRESPTGTPHMHESDQQWQTEPAPPQGSSPVV